MKNIEEKYIGFNKLAKEVGSPKLAAFIGRKKYGKEGMKDSKSEHKKEDKAMSEDTLQEGLRLIHTETGNGNARVAKVYKDHEWDEHRVKHFVNGVHQKEADYHSDKEDSMSHAKHWTSEKPKFAKEEAAAPNNKNNVSEDYEDELDDTPISARLGKHDAKYRAGKYPPKASVTQNKGTYGSEHDTDEHGEETKKSNTDIPVKKGRGRPKKVEVATGGKNWQFPEKKDMPSWAAHEPKVPAKARTVKFDHDKDRSGGIDKDIDESVNLDECATIIQPVKTASYAEFVKSLGTEKQTPAASGPEHDNSVIRGKLDNKEQVENSAYAAMRAKYGFAPVDGDINGMKKIVGDAKNFNEETEQLDELSTDTLKSYRDKAYAAHKTMPKSGSPSIVAKRFKREDGIMHAGSVIHDRENPIKSPKVHDLAHLSHGEAYDRTQTDENIKDGDVLKVNGGVAVLNKAWPVMVHGKSESLHEFKPGHTIHTVDSGRYAASGKLADEVHSGRKDTNESTEIPFVVEISKTGLMQFKYEVSLEEELIVEGFGVSESAVIAMAEKYIAALNESYIPEAKRVEKTVGQIKRAARYYSKGKHKGFGREVTALIRNHK